MKFGRTLNDVTYFSRRHTYTGVYCILFTSVYSIRHRNQNWDLSLATMFMNIPVAGNLRRLDGGDGRRSGLQRDRLAACERGKHLRLHLLRDLHCVRFLLYSEPLHWCHHRQLQRTQEKGEICAKYR